MGKFFWILFFFVSAVPTLSALKPLKTIFSSSKKSSSRRWCTSEQPTTLGDLQQEKVFTVAKKIFSTAASVLSFSALGGIANADSGDLETITNKCFFDVTINGVDAGASIT